MLLKNELAEKQQQDDSREYIKENVKEMEGESIVAKERDFSCKGDQRQRPVSPAIEVFAIADRTIKTVVRQDIRNTADTFHHKFVFKDDHAIIECIPIEQSIGIEQRRHQGNDD